MSKHTNHLGPSSVLGSFAQVVASLNKAAQAARNAGDEQSFTTLRKLYLREQAALREQRSIRPVPIVDDACQMWYGGGSDGGDA